MTNQDIKKAAYEVVAAWEKDHGRDCRVYENDGYDLLSESYERTDVRHIEVKGTTCPSPSQFALEVSEYDALQNDDKWWLYIVVSIGNIPAVHAFDRTKVIRHISGIYYQFTLRFGSDDFRTGRD